MSINNENAKAMSFSDLYENSIKDFKEGQIVKGKIVAIRENEAIIDIGYKSEGVLQVSEFMDPASLKVGDEVDFRL